MTLPLALPVYGGRILEPNEPRPATQLPYTGHGLFRKTQGFDDVNPAFPNLGPHRALDIGNFYCGDHALAMIDGTARAATDSAGALLVFVEGTGQDAGLRTLQAHLDAWVTVKPGTNASVRRGQQIGIVGDTGLGAVCHHHIQLWISGVRVDPWLYLPQNYVAPQEDEDMKIPGGLKPLGQAILGARNRLRVDATTKEGSKVTDEKVWVQVYGYNVPGEEYDLGDGPRTDYAWVGVYGRTWFVATPLLTDFEVTDAFPLEVGGGMTEDEVNDLVATRSRLAAETAANAVVAAAQSEASKY